MITHLRLAAAAILIVSVLGVTGAAAQSIGPDESLGAPGAMPQQTVLTPQQRRAIYEAVRRERVGSPEVAMAAVVGAPVPPAALLHDLPGSATGTVDRMADDPSVPVLKYAMVADDVVVIDPIAMRVVDVIHRDGVKP